MNISFEGNIISNTLPTEASNQPAGASIKRGRTAPSNSNKRFRRDRNAMAGGGAIPPMGDESFSSVTSTTLDDLAESLRECSQRLDSSLLDFSGNSHVGSLNASMSSLGVGGASNSLGGSFSGGLNFGTSSNTAPLAPPTQAASSRLSAGPPPLMSFHRVPRDSTDRL